MAATDRTDRRAVVLGAGITGLAAARRLRRDRYQVTVVERRDRVGGTMHTVARDGFRFELGPNTVHSTPALEALCRDAGCHDRLHAAGGAGKKRYLLHLGRLVALPGSPPSLLTTPILPLSARLRLLTEPLRRRGPTHGESVGAFVTRRLGRHAAATFGEAMVQGVYAGDPDELHVDLAFSRVHQLEQEHGSLLAGLRQAKAAADGRRTVVGFEGGFSALARTLAADLDVRLDTEAHAVRPTPQGFALDLDGPGGAATLEAERLIVTVPPATSARLLRSLGPLDRARALPHAPVAVVALGFARREVEHPLDGFGFLAPHSEGLPLLGCLFPSTLFQGVAPPDAVSLVAMIGGRRRPELVERDDDALVETACEALAPLVGLRGAPQVTEVRRWQPGILQPTGALRDARAQADAIERAHPGLEILGAWRSGVGVPDCVAAGWDTPSNPTID